MDLRKAITEKLSDFLISLFEEFEKFADIVKDKYLNVDSGFVKGREGPEFRIYIHKNKKRVISHLIPQKRAIKFRIINLDTAVNIDKFILPPEKINTKNYLERLEYKIDSHENLNLICQLIVMILEKIILGKEPIYPVPGYFETRGSGITPHPKNLHNETIYKEGERLIGEIQFFKRDPVLVRRAKNKLGFKCQVCNFNFEEKYGELGKEFIECHHLNPFSERDEKEWTKNLQTNIEEVSVLCANCHRMIHRRKPAFTLDELRKIINNPTYVMQ